MKDLENTRDYEIESANGIKIRGVLEEKGEKVKISLFDCSGLKPKLWNELKFIIKKEK